MRITAVRSPVVGTPWRDLVFVELETDGGLVGVGEVRPVNKTDSFVAVVDELVDAAPTVDPVDGCFAAPERPGLGLRLDHDACARHPRTGARLQLFVEGCQKREGG